MSGGIVDMWIFLGVSGMVGRASNDALYMYVPHRPQ